ncbi:DUF3052 family protein [Streptomyces sp. NPDC005435]|uniref:DUF3052 family protein n=1 Tax=Streptomyces sp. NPDC005435 TaxID=3154464 RepID=UPI003455E639
MRLPRRAAGSAVMTADEDSEVVADVVLLWWRESDGDVADALSDALSRLADGGAIGLLTPKTGRDGHLEPGDITEGAVTAGAVQRAAVPAAGDWNGTRLEVPGARR